MSKRLKIVAAVCVYREGFSERLAANICTFGSEKLDQFNQWPAPKALVELTQHGGPVDNNAFIAEMSINTDGSNVRGVKFIKEITHQQFNGWVYGTNPEILPL